MLSMSGSGTVQFLRLIVSGNIHLCANHIGNLYHVDHVSGLYKVFRETVSYDNKITGQNVVLLVGFRLRMLRSNRLLQWIFRRICTLSTPIWSGFLGFSYVVAHRFYD
jgi:hypothetical protein